MADCIEDPELGPLVWSKHERAWLSNPAHRAVGFIFHITGIPAPHEALLLHAKDIIHKKQEFLDEVRRFLENEADAVRRLHYYLDEILKLRIECVCLLWPNRPNDGMIYFEGGRDYRLWRCDYIDRCPQRLGFDS